jgi:predicted nucleic acid-binding protein
LGLARLREFLRKHQKVGLDSNIFIYKMDVNPRYLELATHVLEWLESLDHFGVTSTLTMAELLTQPYRDADEKRVDRCYGLLSTYPNLEWVAPDLVTADLAARFRAQHRMRTPDAIQAATAVLSGATGFVSNDPVFRRVEAFETMVLDDLL